MENFEKQTRFLMMSDLIGHYQLGDFSPVGLVERWFSELGIEEKYDLMVRGSYEDWLLFSLFLFDRIKTDQENYKYPKNEG